jgi:hypothetical protein
MSRKNWSNLFLLLGSVNLALGIMPSNPFKLVDWIALPCCLTLGAIARRRMI